MATGRPQKWTKELVESFYLPDLEEWVTNTNEILLEKWLARHKLHYQHFTIFCERSELFLETYTRARMIIDSRLIEGGLTKQFDINTIKFYLTNRSHNWKEKPEVSISTNVSVSKLLDDIDGKSKTIIDIDASPPKIPHQPSGDKQP